MEDMAETVKRIKLKDAKVTLQTSLITKAAMEKWREVGPTEVKQFMWANATLEFHGAERKIALTTAATTAAKKKSGLNDGRFVSGRFVLVRAAIGTLFQRVTGKRVRAHSSLNHLLDIQAAGILTQLKARIDTASRRRANLERVTAVWRKNVRSEAASELKEAFLKVRGKINRWELLALWDEVNNEEAIRAIMER